METQYSSVDEIVGKAKKAFDEYKNFTQEQVDKIVLAAVLAVNNARLHLARIAIEETQRGVFEDKVIKIQFASEYIYNKIRDKKTCGIIEHNALWGIIKIADPMGVIAAITPVTNPTSTVVFKSLLALKTRNAVVFSPHLSAKKCSSETAKLILQAAEAAGAPKGIIGCIENPSADTTNQLMHHKDIAIILATGGPGLVKAAYSSGKPAIGVGAGNAPALIDETADLSMAVTSILTSKTFDNGMICASEQSVVAVDSIYDALKKEFALRGAYILSPKEKEKLAKVVVIDNKLNPNIVGQSAIKIAAMGDITVPNTTKVLIAETTEVGEQEPFSREKLSPMLALYRASDFYSGTKIAESLVEFGGLGHTAILYTNPDNRDRIEHFGSVLKTIRILVNIPSSHGAIGDLYNFYLEPSLTLGCGSYGGNIIGENISTKHLINVKIVAERRENMMQFRIPSQIYFKCNCLQMALQNLAGHKKALIVTDAILINTEDLKLVTSVLEDINIRFDIFSGGTASVRNFSIINEGLTCARELNPDVIIAFGSGSCIDIAKTILLMYDHPDANIQELALRFMDIGKRVYKLTGKKPKTFFVTIPSTSGGGNEVTPFSFVVEKGIEYPIADNAMFPDMVILDPILVKNMPKALTAGNGFSAITHAIESIVSVAATDYTISLAMGALHILFKYLPIAYNEGANNIYAREKVHYASAMAGIAFANAYVGVCHSLAHKLCIEFNLSHGIANSLMLCEVIRYNATESPSKFTAFPQYKTPKAIVRYAKAAESIGILGGNDEEKVETLVTMLTNLRKTLNLPLSIQEAGVSEEKFLAKVDELSTFAFDDQCTGTNPRYPLISELRTVYMNAFYKK